jgi:endogenous inhibitor of DNA gyrase (YacG/DUF329 family)
MTSSHDAPSPPIRARIVRCPACGGDSIYAPTNASRPFCSERCKNTDLGAWASESYRVPANPPPEGDEDLTPGEATTGYTPPPLH